MKNPIFKELINLKLISKQHLITINNKTRDKNIKVIKDLKSKIIFLEKYITSTEYYSSLKYEYDDKETKDKSKRKIANIKTLFGNIKTPIIEDDLRRVDKFKKYLKNKDILDFGCGWGGFLKNIKNYKTLNGVELRKECLDYIKNNIKKINMSNNIDYFEHKFDLINVSCFRTYPVSSRNSESIKIEIKEKRQNHHRSPSCE